VITVDATELAGLLTDLKRTACTDRRLDGYAGVALTLTRHHDEGLVLAGASTDRFRAGMAYVPIHDVLGGLSEHLLTLDHLKDTLARLKGESGQVSLESNPGKLALESAGDGRAVFDTPSLSRFPRIASLMTNPGRDIDHRDVPARLDARYLESFVAIAKRRGERVRLHRNSDGRMVNVFIGEAYRGALMACGPIEQADSECPAFDFPARQASTQHTRTGHAA
jgi:hypothetical protein